MELTDSFSRFLNSHFDYEKILRLINATFIHGFDSFKKLSLGLDLNNKFVEEYPKYSFPFILFSNMGSFNYKKIYSLHHSTDKQLKDLLTSHSEFIIETSRYNKYPHRTLFDLRDDIFLQNICFNSSKELFYSDEMLKWPFTYEKNRYSCLCWDKLPNSYSNIEDNSYLLTYFLYILLYKLSSTGINVLETILSKIINFEEIISLKNDFNTFMNSVSNTFNTDLVNLDLSLVQGLINHGLNIQPLVKSIESDIKLELSKAFSDFLDSRVIDATSLIAEEHFNVIRGKYILDMIKYIYDNKSYFFTTNNSTFFESLKNNDIYRYETLFKSNVELNAMLEFMIINYMYKNSPFKFINLMQFTVRNFVNSYCDTETIDDYYKQLDLKTTIKTMSSAINPSNMLEYLNSNNTKQVIVNNIKNQTNIKFSFYKFVIGMIDEFVEYIVSETTIIEDILDRVHIVLKNQGLIGPYDDWMKNYIFLKLYLKSFFRKSIISGINNVKLFSNTLNQITSLLNSTSTSNLFIVFDQSDISYQSTDLVEKSTDEIFDFVKMFDKSCLTKEIIFNNLSFFLNDSFIFTSPMTGVTYSKNNEMLISWDFSGMTNYSMSLDLYKKLRIDPNDSHSQLILKKMDTIVENIPVDYVDENNNRIPYTWLIGEYPPDYNYLVVATINDGVSTKTYESPQFQMIDSPIDSMKMISLINPRLDEFISPLDDPDFDISYAKGIDIRWTNLLNLPITISIFSVNNSNMAVRTTILNNTVFNKTECSYTWIPSKQDFGNNNSVVRLLFVLSSKVENRILNARIYTRPFRILK